MIRPSPPIVKPNATRTFPFTAHAAPGSPPTVAATAPAARPLIHLATASAPVSDVVRAHPGGDRVRAHHHVRVEYLQQRAN